MAKRQLDNLILKNEDLIVSGDLEISGNVIIEGGSLIVSGKLTITGNCKKFSVIDCDISVGSLDICILDSETKLCTYIKDGDIFVANDFVSNINFRSCGNIDINGDLYCLDLICLSLTVATGSIEAENLHVEFDIYSMGAISASNISARDVFTEYYIDLNDGGISAYGDVYAPNGILNCSSFIQ